MTGKIKKVINDVIYGTRDLRYAHYVDIHFLSFPCNFMQSHAVYYMKL